MKRYKLLHLDCANCANKIEQELQKSPKLKGSKIAFASSALYTNCEDIELLKSTIKSIEPEVEITQESSKLEFLNAELFVLVALIGVFLASLYAYHFIPQVKSSFEIYCKILWIGIYLISGREVFKGAYRNFKKKEFFDENVLMLSASIAAFCIGAWEEAVSIMLFFSAGEYLQNLSVRRSKESINALAHFTPQIAHKIQDKGTLDTQADMLQIDDEIVVYVGEMVPADGMLLEQESSFDCSALSGESLPVDKKYGQEVLAGSIALGKVATIRITRPFDKSQIAKITELIESASTQKSQTENFITTFAKYYTPIVFFVALAIALIPPLAFSLSFEDWIYRALVVLMVSCPCALVISVPIGYFGGIAASSKAGILIKGSNYLEALSRLALIAFDKTGTLTKGVFKVVDVIPQKGYSKIDVLHYALCAQNLSSHPIAQSIKKEYDKQLSHAHHISEFEELSGLGVRVVCDNREIVAGNDKILHKFKISHDTCDIQGSVIHIGVDKHYLGYILIADELKSEAIEVIDKLKSMDIKPIILSGDGKYPCSLVADKLQCDYYHSLLPQDKAKIFFELKSHTKGKVGFVGDGINDAPTLALADVGMSMGSGSDISRQNADVIILNDSLESVLKAIKIAKKTKTIIYQNIIFALGIKGVFIVLGLFGIASIWEAVFGDVGVALLALANAMRTMRIPR